MKNAINKIFSDEVDDWVHYEFVKFGKGVYENRYLLEAKKQKDKWSVKTSSEFANFFVLKLLEKAPENISVRGAIITTLDMKKDIGFEIFDVKNYMGIKQYLIDTTINKQSLLNLINKYPRAFYALSFSANGSELKIKAKAPKNGKPGNKGENEPKADFCSLKTLDGEIIRDLFFDISDFNKIKIKHTIQINEIEIPKEVAEPEKIRELAKRKGVVKRVINVDGKEKVEEKSFVI